MKIYEIVNMYNFHFDRRIYFENKTTFIEFFFVRPGHWCQNFYCEVGHCVTIILIVMHDLKRCGLVFCRAHNLKYLCA